MSLPTFSLLFLLIICEAFISFNSLQVGHKSEARSRKVFAKLSTFQSQSPQGIQRFITGCLHILHTIFDPLYPVLKTQNTIEFEHFLIRKAAHMTQFFVLALLWLSFFESIGFNWSHTLFYSLALVLFGSVIDEFIQHFIPNRCASVIDVLVDFSGGLLASFGYFLFFVLFG
ncbi:MAG: VanZ family protein [Culicoidibacterales bacterium]